MKDKNTAGILALFLGGFGIHRFYLGENTSGVVHLIAGCIPPIFIISWIVAWVNAIQLLSMDNDTFNVKYNKAHYKATRRAAEEAEVARQRPYYDANMRRHDTREYRPTERARTTPAYADNTEIKNRGIRRFREFDYDGAIEDFEKAIELNPRDVAVHFNLACAYSLNENAEEAFVHLDKAVEMGFNDFRRIKEHDALAYLRIQPQFEEFEQNGFRLQKQPEKVTLPVETDAQQTVESNLELGNGDLLEQLKRLGEYRERGLLTEEEFAAQKRKLLG